MILRLDVPREVRLGEAVPVTLRAENNGAEPLDLSLRGRDIAFDIIVTSARNEVVWRRLEGEIVPAILRLVRLEPHQTLTLTTRWDQRSNAGHRASAGLYSVRGELLTDMPTPFQTEPVHLSILAT